MSTWSGASAPWHPPLWKVRKCILCWNKDLPASGRENPLPDVFSGNFLSWETAISPALPSVFSLPSRWVSAGPRGRPQAHGLIWDSHLPPRSCVTCDGHLAVCQRVGIDGRLRVNNWRESEFPM